MTSKQDAVLFGVHCLQTSLYFTSLHIYIYLLSSEITLGSY